MTDSKRQKVLETMEEIERHRGVVPHKLLQHAVGVMGWVSSVAISQNKEPVKDSNCAGKGWCL